MRHLSGSVHNRLLQQLIIIGNGLELLGKTMNYSLLRTEVKLNYALSGPPTRIELVDCFKALLCECRDIQH